MRSECCYLVYVFKLLLIVSGDIEENPGLQRIDSSQLANFSEALQRVETGIAHLLAKVTYLHSDQTLVEANVREMCCIAPL